LYRNGYTPWRKYVILITSFDEEILRKIHIER